MILFYKIPSKKISITHIKSSNPAHENSDLCYHSIYWIQHIPDIVSYGRIFFKCKYIDTIPNYQTVTEYMQWTVIHMNKTVIFYTMQNAL